MGYETARTERDPSMLADSALVLRTRSGDVRALGELRRRHRHAGVTVAASVSNLDPVKVTDEAFSRSAQAIAAGGSPSGSFRAYLFASIRSTAATWGKTARRTADDVLDPQHALPPARADAETLDRSLIHQAFRRLPARWQEVLWYTEVEQMRSADVAPLLGLRPGAVAALAGRAREGLRTEWLSAHLRSVAAESECRDALELIGDAAHLGRRDRARLDEHLERCTRCTIVADEADDISQRLALVLLPLTVGIAGTAGYLAALQAGESAVGFEAEPVAGEPAATTPARGPMTPGARRRSRAFPWRSR
ncbi:hypothetical protein [Microbacterium aureliae]